MTEVNSPNWVLWSCLVVAALMVLAVLRHSWRQRKIRRLEERLVQLRDSSRPGLFGRLMRYGFNLIILFGLVVVTVGWLGGG